MATYNDIAELLLSGLTTRQTAEELGISPSTVSNVAKRGGLEFSGGVWSEPSTGRVEITNLERIVNFFSAGSNILKGILFEPAPPPIPDRPQVPQRPDIGFGLRDLPKMLGVTAGDGRRHMELTVQVNFRDETGLKPHIQNMRILQYDDPEIIRQTVLAKMPMLNKEDIVEMYIWRGDEYFIYDESDFEFDEADYPED